MILHNDCSTAPESTNTTPTSPAIDACLIDIVQDAHTSSDQFIDEFDTHQQGE